MVWTDGSRYTGQWVKGIQHGYGKMIFPDGTFKEGYFDNNVFVGPLPSKNMMMQEQMRKSLYKTPLKNTNATSTKTLGSDFGSLTDQKTGMSSKGMMTRRTMNNSNNSSQKAAKEPLEKHSLNAVMSKFSNGSLH